MASKSDVKILTEAGIFSTLLFLEKNVSPATGVGGSRSSPITLLLTFLLFFALIFFRALPSVCFSSVIFSGCGCEVVIVGGWVYFIAVNPNCKWHKVNHT